MEFDPFDINVLAAPPGRRTIVAGRQRAQADIDACWGACRRFFLAFGIAASALAIAYIVTWLAGGSTFELSAVGLPPAMVVTLYVAIASYVIRDPYGRLCASSSGVLLVYRFSLTYTASTVAILVGLSLVALFTDSRATVGWVLAGTSASLLALMIMIALHMTFGRRILLASMTIEALSDLLPETCPERLLSYGRWCDADETLRNYQAAIAAQGRAPIFAESVAFERRIASNSDDETGRHDGMVRLAQAEARRLAAMSD